MSVGHSIQEDQAVSDSNLWNKSDAIALCTIVEMVCQSAGCHIALTGGLLYKSGQRKDCDILFYRIRQRDKIDMDVLWMSLAEIGIIKLSGFGWCYKCEWLGRKIDCFFPEEQEGEYKADASSGCTTQIAAREEIINP